MAATSTVTLTSAWTKIADDTDAAVLASTGHVAGMEVAVTATDSAPSSSLVGHHLKPGDGVVRDVFGEGFYWARVPSGASVFTAVVIAVTK